MDPIEKCYLVLESDRSDHRADGVKVLHLLPWFEGTDPDLESINAAKR